MPMPDSQQFCIIKCEFDINVFTEVNDWRIFGNKQFGN